ncbi:glycoside hydrolase family 127 protein [Cesiribacter sp. SM1]|uniref:glycoside hydrolase family 127 protein n=1 Tax=Cesiribacter sp. SM1 TaxID=2861196 RepID=UPI001CD57720|nr:glycoside hydrolase family 127 protein [Cesiribacter sp. SM1]
MSSRAAVMKGVMRGLLVLPVVVGICALETKAQDKPVEPFPLSAVRLLDSPFKQAEQTDLEYIFSLETDRLLAPFLREAGLPPKAKGYGNWEATGLDGHTAGHYLSALSLMYASTGNQQVLERLNYMLGELKRAQDANDRGYIGGIPGGEAMWQEIASGKIEADNFSLNQKWVPWYNIHKLYAGLRDAYVYAGSQQAKDMLIKLSDWSLQLVSGLSDQQIQQMLTAEHGGMNEVFADVAAITGDQKYLELARKFSHQKVLQPLLAGQDQLTGMHANTQIPKVIGFKRVAEVANDGAWQDASRFFWETVANNRSVAIGGNSVREHFHPADDFTPMITDREGPETCNTYNMLRLSKMLYQTSSDLDYIAFYERGLYNHILSSQHPEGGFVYFTPMRPQHYRVYSQPHQSFWCCVGSGLENHAKYGELIYAHTDNELYVNLFIPSQLNWQERGLTLTQQTRFPHEEQTLLTVQKAKAGAFTMKIRYPEWVANGAMKVQVNGKDFNVQAAPGTYVSISRKWKKGDRVAVTLPMQTRLEQLPDGSPYYAVMHGPLVMAAKTGTENLEGLFADSSRMGHIASGELYPLQEAPLFVSADKDIVSKIKPVAGKPLTFTAASLIHQPEYKSLELTPFYNLHEARYMLYWQLVTPRELDSIQQATQALEREKMVLEKQTIDQVAPGEQQPESDHFFKAEGTESGVHQNRHWRHATGWFSYNLKDEKGEAALLRITYYGQDKDRNFDILVNNTKIATVKLDGSHGDTFYTVDYPIPAELVKHAPDHTLVTKFVAHQGSVAGGIYYVRLMKKD